MFKSLCFSLMLTTALAVSAKAADIKQEVDKIGTAYTEAVAKHDAAAIAALYVKDPIWISPAGETKTDIKATYEENFKNGENKIVSKVNNVWPQGDGALGNGDVDVTFNNDPPVHAYWSAVYVRDGGQLKIKMLTVGIKPPPPTETAAK
jgi:ketosteroid isomerase-like protein